MGFNDKVTRYSFLIHTTLLIMPQPVLYSAEQVPHTAANMKKIIAEQKKTRDLAQIVRSGNQLSWAAFKHKNYVRVYLVIRDKSGKIISSNAYFDEKGNKIRGTDLSLTLPPLVVSKFSLSPADCRRQFSDNSKIEYQAKLVCVDRKHDGFDADADGPSADLMDVFQKAFSVDFLTFISEGKTETGAYFQSTLFPTLMDDPSIAEAEDKDKTKAVATAIRRWFESPTDDTWVKQWLTRSLCTLFKAKILSYSHERGKLRPDMRSPEFTDKEKEYFALWREVATTLPEVDQAIMYQNIEEMEAMITSNITHAKNPLTVDTPKLLDANGDEISLRDFVTKIRITGAIVLPTVTVQGLRVDKKNVIDMEVSKIQIYVNGPKEGIKEGLSTSIFGDIKPMALEDSGSAKHSLESADEGDSQKRLKQEENGDDDKDE